VTTSAKKAEIAVTFLERLRNGEVTDEVFDVLFPFDLAAISGKYWTPLSVARRAGELLQDLGARHLLDVGSGCGKFCIAAAASAPNVEFTGVEQRSRLVDAAASAAAQLGLQNVRFRCGDATVAASEPFDALYLFNPFAENVFSQDERLDDTVELSESRLVGDLLRVEIALSRAAVGTLVVTYHGFGGRIPDSFDVFHTERAGTDRLRVFAKTRPRATPGRYLVELDDRIVYARVRQQKTSGTNLLSVSSAVSDRSSTRERTSRRRG
jgi:SAM-dependent methyltransferase